MKNVTAYLRSQEHLKAAEYDILSLVHHGLDMIQDIPLRSAVTEFMDDYTPLDFYWRPDTAKDGPTHHASQFGLLHSVIERLVMIPAIAPHIEVMCNTDGAMNALALDVALAATLISDTQYHGFLNTLKKNRGDHAEYAAYAWRKFYPKTDPSVTGRVVAERVADAALWHHGGNGLPRPPSHIRPEMRLVALVNAFCTNKAISTRSTGRSLSRFPYEKTAP